MLRHLFKLIWNKKKSHSLLMVEIWASFLVLFGLATLVIYNLNNYIEPLGFEYENVWVINLNQNQDTTDIREKTLRLVQRIKQYKEVEGVTRMSGNVPFSFSAMDNSISYKKVATRASNYRTDADFAKTMGVQMLAGRWYTNADSIGKYTPIVINKKAQDALFGNENPIGKMVGGDENQAPKSKVVGVIEYFKKDSEFMKDEPAVFELIKNDNNWDNTLLVRVKPDVTAVFEGKMVKDINAMLVGWSVEVQHLTETRKNQHNLVMVPALIFLIVSVFLIINVSLGLFGILNLNVGTRRGEIGLRRAIGSTQSGITTQFLGEMAVIATFSLILGLLFAIQFPFLNVFGIESQIYVLAILTAIVLIYFLVFLCAWYPSRQVAGIHPATALHEE